MGCDKNACVYTNVYTGFKVFLDGEVEEVFYFWVDVYGCEYMHGGAFFPRLRSLENGD